MESRRPRASLTKQLLFSSSLAKDLGAIASCGELSELFGNVFVLLGKNQSDQMREKCIAIASYNN